MTKISQFSPAIKVLAETHQVLCPEGNDTCLDAKLHDFLLGLGVPCNDQRPKVKVPVALHFRGYDHANVGTTVVVLEHFYSSWDCLRLDFEHPKGMDETFGVCINFWNGFALALARVDNYDGDGLAAPDADGSKFVEIVKKFGRPKQEEGRGMACKKCGGKGVDETGNNDLPCGCEAGDKALFNVSGVIGQVTGAEMKRHFLNFSPEPIELGVGGSQLLASTLPGRV